MENRGNRFSNVVSIVALVVSLSGAAYAGGLIDTADVVNNSLTGADIKDSSLSSSDIRRDSIALSDLAQNVLPAGAAQRRISEACDVGSSISVVHSNGTVECEFDDPAAFSTYSDDVGNLPKDGFGTVGSLEVPVGKYLILSKIRARANTIDGVAVTCELIAEGDSDRSAADGASAADQTIVNMVVHEFTQGGSAILSCTSGGMDVRGLNMKITALSVNSLSNVPAT